MKSSRIAIITVLLTISSIGTAFYDDFNDGDISDWEPRCAPGNWQATSGMVYGSTGGTPAAFVPVTQYRYANCEISVSAKGGHAFGVIARLTDGDTGVIAYISPDAGLARIRLVHSGNLSDILSTMNLPLPSNEWYELTFILAEANLSLEIYVPSTGDLWTVNAVDPNPQVGTFGLLMGDEPGTYWDWISVSDSTSTGAVESGLINDPSFQVCPNPFRGSATFNVTGVEDGPLSIRIFDMSGRLVASPEFSSEGSERSLLWDGRGDDSAILPSGVYMMRLSGSDDAVYRLVKLD